MSEETIDNNIEFDLPMNKSSVIKVIGVGGGGSNAVNHMKRLGIKDVNYIICNTDAQALDHSEVSNKVQLGASLTEGMGAGANDRGLRLAIALVARILGTRSRPERRADRGCARLHRFRYPGPRTGAERGPEPACRSRRVQHRRQHRHGR